MTAYKTVTVADAQLLNGGGDVTRDALGLSIGGSQSDVIETIVSSSSPNFFNDQLRTGREYAYRLFGSDLVESDKHWLSFVNGGVYNEQTYNTIFVNQTFTDHHHVELNPYSEMETKLNGSYNTQSPSFISCKPEVKNFYKLYESSKNSNTDITAIPNGYFVNEGFGAITVSQELNRRQKRRLRRKLRSQIAEDFTLNNIETFQTSSQLKNIFVSGDDVYNSIGLVNNYSDLLPYYIKTNIDFDGGGDFVKQVTNNNFEQRFIKILKDSILEQDGAPAPTNVAFNLSTEQFNSNTEVETSSADAELKVVDVFELMNYSLTNYNTEESNFHYLYDDSEKALSQYDNKSIRRFDKTIPTIKQTNYLLNFLNSETFLSSFVNQPLNLNQKYNEVVAYRIEKLGGSGTGDRFTQDTVQNFWFLNNGGSRRFEFLDNQVLLGQDYTYRIYKYVLIAGLEYSYSDLSITRTIADLSTPDEANWCLEFFNPETGVSSAPVYNDNDDQVETIVNELATTAQVTSPDKYLADFKLTVLPSVKIVEVPLLTKQVSILDSPTNSVNVIPTFTLDNSNRLVFGIKYNTNIPHV